MKPEALDERLKKLEADPPAERGGRFPLTGRGIYSLFGAIDSLEMDGVGLYSSGMLSQELQKLLGLEQDPDKPEPRFEDVIHEVWTRLWKEYHPDGREEASVMPVNPEQAEQLYRLLRELLITPIVRIDALRSLPHRRSDPGRSVLSVYSV